MSPRQGHERTAPMQLETQVLPSFLKKVAEPKSGRVTYEAVDSYLNKHRTLFDRQLLRRMFDEADYRLEGSLLPKDLKDSLAGNFPYRTCTMHWRELVALVLQLPALNLAETDHLLVEKRLSTKEYTKERPGLATYNSSSFWDSLPPAPRHLTRGKSAGSIRATQPTAEWGAVLGRTAANREAHHPAGSDGTLSSTRGIVSTAPIDAEQHINAQLVSDLPRSTFEGVERFQQFADGLVVMQNIAVDTNPATRASSHRATSTSKQMRVQSAPSGMRSHTEQRNMTDSTTLCNRFDCRAMTQRANPRQPVMAWSSTLPPSAIDMPKSALSALRAAVAQARPSKARFELYHRTLSPDTSDLQTALGKPLELRATLSLRCTEPLRPTKVLQQSSYVHWADYARRCPTAPTMWFDQHPSMLAQL